ncbi:Prp31 C terminal domain-containing protein [Truncatella angustata]|uniref:Prp31 C terminal domain-containing protein n=1 Tax=Truncatella angustata TaxID=152316 RepID=A0A9P9A2Y4_9PEZI|nr:Prp31 C terminal domain-containing protein [Truncatella angustata]KAH6659897.1 Prp31 C terminal domain-containing protein [Truncatella angustata]
MSTLADELLNDFEDSGSEQGDPQDDLGLDGEDSSVRQANGHSKDDDDDMVLDGDEEPPEEEDQEMSGLNAAAIHPMDDPDEAKAKVEQMQLGSVKDVRKVTKVMDRLEPLLKVSHPAQPSTPPSRARGTANRLASALQDIQRYQSQPLNLSTINIGNIEDNPEYKILTESNTLSTEIDGEIMKVHKFIRDHYSARFPELETLIQNPIQYAKVVAILGNGPMDSSSIKALQDSTDNVIGEPLKHVLEKASLMTVTLEATRSQGQNLGRDELDRIFRACQMIVSMDKAKKTLTEYVQSRMNVFAPNLTAIIGSLAAAQLINTAGGLTPLSRTPSCNLAAWGSKRQANSAFATNVQNRQQGFLYHSPIIRGIPTDLKKKAMKAVAAKVVLAARADTSHTNPDGAYGEELRGQCLERLDKMTAPPPNKGQRALPAPDDKPSRKRGGRLARNAKAAVAMTELRKAQNRMVFGKEEKETDYGIGDGTVGMGMIGHAQEGRIRATQIDNKTRAKLSQKNKGWGAIDPIGAAGTASSLAFTPAQGIELVDPKVQAELKRKRAAEDDRYFKSGAFTQVGGTNSQPPSKKVDVGAGRMLPPPLPAKR